MSVAMLIEDGLASVFVMADCGNHEFCSSSFYMSSLILPLPSQFGIAHPGMSHHQSLKFSQVCESAKLKSFLTHPQRVICYGVLNSHYFYSVSTYL